MQNQQVLSKHSMRQILNETTPELVQH